jgi:hypothetical protein
LGHQGILEGELTTLAGLIRQDVCDLTSPRHESGVIM